MYLMKEELPFQARELPVPNFGAFPHTLHEMLSSDPVFLEYPVDNSVMALVLYFNNLLHIQTLTGP